MGNKKSKTETIINQDLNMLLSPEEIRIIRKTLKNETLMFLKEEIK